MSIIRDQLAKSQAFKRAVYNPTTDTYIIKKSVEIRPIPDKSYFIVLDDNIINNNSSTLAINWNSGKSPVSKYYIIEVLKIIGGYLYCIGIPCDEHKNKINNNIWEGYLPLNCIDIKEQVEDRNE